MSLQLTALKILSRQGKQPCLLEYAKDKRNQGHFNDVIIKAGDTSIPANRMVLSCFFSFFEQIFTSETNHQVNDSVVDIPDVDGKSLELLIQYIYTGQICIDSDNVLNVLAAVDHLEMNEVKRFCFEFLENSITLNNCITILITAKQYQNFELRDKVYKFISENYQSIIQTQAFKFLSYNELFFCVFHLKQKFHIIDAVLCLIIMTWIKYDVEERKKFLVKLEQFVNNKDYFHKLVEEALSASSEQEYLDFHRLLNLSSETVIKETKILSIGGYKTKTKVVEIYNAGEKTNVIYPDLPIPLYNHCSLKLDSFVYCIGGEIDYKTHSNKVFRLKYNQSDLKWEEVAPMRERRSKMAASVLNQKLIVCGGWINGEVLNSSESYDVQLDQWTATSPLKENRQAHTSVSYNGSLLCLGGSSMYKTFSTVEQLNDLKESWRYFSSMQTPRAQFAAVKYDDCVYVIGGIDKQNKVVRSVEKFVFNANKWVFVCNLVVGRYIHSACVLQGKIFVVGGKDSENEPVKEVESYEPTQNKWRVVGLTEYDLYGHSLVVV